MGISERCDIHWGRPRHRNQCSGCTLQQSGKSHYSTNNNEMTLYTMLIFILGRMNGILTKIVQKDRVFALSLFPTLKRKNKPKRNAYNWIKKIGKMFCKVILEYKASSEVGCEMNRRAGLLVKGHLEVELRGRIRGSRGRGVMKKQNIGSRGGEIEAKIDLLKNW